jgi:hypothetical protein
MCAVTFSATVSALALATVSAGFRSINDFRAGIALEL